ncbi:TonB-dependent receptor [Phenylobacterium montanum]|uniref:TonB-dependent receptor n=1 Tax=Phenylobacterium montanum TaxID=2823693 RepID=A0A975G2G6_9CAUL|nr:TonB-dependent receptor [Caulobacter sp. S6]QUD89332.1 TonB-dependent receptor [Caulobacter sp. S6]
MQRLHALLASAALVALATAARAAEAPADATQNQVSEVIVTAQKRAVRLQDAPLAVTAFNSQTLKQATVVNLTDLDGRIPNVTLEAVATFPNASSFSIRGLGFGDVESTFEPTVGAEINGVYLARNVGATQDLFDIDSVEVRRGPQGTLDGGNTIGGVVAMTTKKPTGQLDGEIELTGGDRGRLEARGALDIPLIKDVLSARVSIMDLNYGGYLHNIANGATLGGIDSLSERLTLLYTPTDRFDATLVVDHTRDRDKGFPNMNGTPAFGSIAPAPDFLLAELGYAANPNQKPYDVNVTFPTFFNFDTVGASVTLNWRFDWGVLTSITGYREYDDNNVNEYGGAGDVTVGESTAPFFVSQRIQNQDQFSQEIHVASPSGKHFLDYVAGVYYLHQHYALQNLEGGSLFGVYPPAQITTQYANQGDDSYAVFGQVDLHFTDKLTLTAGGRYSYESKDFHNTPPFYFPTQFNYSANWSDFSPKAVLNYKITPDNMAYVQYSRGYRSGGFNGRAGSASSAGPYAAEHVDNYEIGIKNEFLNRRLVVNADAFIEKYNNIQEEVQRLNTVTNADETVVANAGAATYQGVEIETHAVLGHGFSADAALGYLDAHFDKFTANLNGPCAGGEDPYFCGVNDYKKIPLPGVPHWSLSGALNYRTRLDFGVFSANINAAYTSKQYTSLTPINVVAPWFSLRKANTIVNGTVSMATPDEKYRVSGWVKNLTDERVLYERFTVGPLSAPESYEPPLTWGVSVGAKF